MKIVYNVFLIFLLVVIDSCGLQVKKEETISESKEQEQRTKDSISTVADSIIKSGGSLSLKETKAIYKLDTNNIENLINMAISMMNEGDLNGALHSLDKALSKAPKLAQKQDIYTYKGMTWQRLKRKDSCYFYLDMAVRMDSTNVRCLDFRARAYAVDSNYKKSIEDINRAIKIQPGNQMLIFARGVYKIHSGDYEGAAKDMTIIPDHIKNDYMTYRNRALVCIKLGYYDEAINQCNVGLTMKRDSYELYRFRSVARYLLEQYNESYEDLKIAVALGDTESIGELKKIGELVGKKKQKQ